MNTDLCINADMTADIAVTDRLEIIKNAGFDGIFIDWYKDDELQPIIEKARSLGLYIHSLHAPFYGMDDIFHDDEGNLAEKMINDLIGTIDSCAKYGINLAVFHAVIGMDNHSPNEIGLTRLAKVIDRAEEMNVRIAFENTEGEEYLKAILDRYGNKEHIGFCFDSGHAMCYNRGSDILGKYGRYLFSTHLNDNMGQTEEEITFYDDSHLLPFDGIADWNKIAQQLRESGFKGPFTFELICKNRPNRHVSDRYERMSFSEFICEAYEKADKFRNLYLKG